jgi:hypothetical protein
MWLRNLKNELVFQSQKARTEVGFLWSRQVFYRKNEKGLLPGVEEAERILTEKYPSRRIIDLDKENFRVYDKREWGSARPENSCVLSSDNVDFVSGAIIIDNRYEEGGITGRDWQGDQLTRKYSSGFVESKETYEPYGCFFAVISLKFAALGAWDGIWLFDRDTNNPVYREIDLLERMSKHPPGADVQLNVHGDINNKRRQVPLKMHISSSHDILQKFLVYAAIDGERIEIGINAIPLCRTGFAIPVGPMAMIFSSGIHHYGSLSDEDIRFTIRENQLTVHRFGILR